MSLEINAVNREPSTEVKPNWYLKDKRRLLIRPTNQVAVISFSSLDSTINGHSFLNIALAFLESVINEHCNLSASNMYEDC